MGLYISSIKVKNWKNFEGASAKLTRRLFLIGPNASGKSNFLDIFRFLRDITLEKGGGFQQAVELRGGVSLIRCLAARQNSDIAIDIEIKDDTNQNESWNYRIKFGQDNNRKPLLKEEFVKHNGTVLLERPDSDDKMDPLRLSQTALEQITANKKFRPIRDFLQSVTYQHLIPQVIRDPQGFSAQQVKNDPYGRDFLQRVEGTNAKVRDSRLNKILIGLKAAAPQLKELKVERDKLGVPHLVGVFEHWRPKGAKQGEAQFSDGTLRLFGLLWSLFEGEGPLLMEEPELSLHSEVVRYLPLIIEKINQQRKFRRQVFISTHSEKMLSGPEIGAGEVLRLEPSPEGTLIKSPTDSPEELEQLKSGLTIADVVLPKSSPKNANQLTFAFD